MNPYFAIAWKNESSFSGSRAVLISSLTSSTWWVCDDDGLSNMAGSIMFLKYLSRYILFCERGRSYRFRFPLGTRAFHLINEGVFGYRKKKTRRTDGREKYPFREWENKANSMNRRRRILQTKSRNQLTALLLLTDSAIPSFLKAISNLNWWDNFNYFDKDLIAFCPSGI